MKKLLMTLSLLISISAFCQTSKDTAFNVNGDTIIHVVSNTTAVFTYPVTTVTVVVKPKVNTPPPNTPPSVNAGLSQAITLPVNAVTLSGTASDPDGMIASYLWSQVSGPNNAVIVSPASSNTSVTGLIAGVYVFKLTATDNKGAVASASVNVTVNPEVIPPVVPSGYMGFGSQVKGGEAFKNSPYHVTNLKASGAGSLADGIKSNSYIVFDVGGVITGFRFDVGNNVSGTFFNLTIDGTTAPSPGITLDNTGAGGNTLGFEGTGNHDIIIKGIRAINAIGGDNFHFLGATNVILDHCSAWGAGDGNCDITNSCKNFTIQNCIFGPGCQCSENGSDRWGGNMLIAYGTGRITIHHSIFYSRTPTGIAERNPGAMNQSGTIPDPCVLDFVSNVVYNWGRNSGSGSGYGTALFYGSYGNVRNSYYYIDNTGGGINNAVSENPYGNPKGTIYAIGNISGNSGKVNGFTATTAYPIDAIYQVAQEDACSSLKMVLGAAGVRYNGLLVDPEELRIVNIIKALHPGCQ